MWRFYEASSMTFGNVHSVYNFVRLTTRLAQYILRKFGIVVVPYIDDFIIISPAISAMKEFSIVLEFLKNLGLQISSKSDGCIPPRLNEKIDILGVNYTFSQSSFKVSIPREKLVSAHEKIDQMVISIKNGRSPTLKEIFSLYGTISFISYFKSYKKELPFLSLLHKTMAEDTDPSFSKKDLANLLLLLVAFKRLVDDHDCIEVSADSLSKPTIFLFSDAMRDSSQVGLGSIVYFPDETAEFAQFFTSDPILLKLYNTGHWEALVPICHLLSNEELRDCNLIVFVDNSSAVIALAKQQSNDVNLATISSLTWKEIAARRITPWFSYVNTLRNPADEPSRLRSFKKFLNQNSAKLYKQRSYPIKEFIDLQQSFANSVKELQLRCKS